MTVDTMTRADSLAALVIIEISATLGRRRMNQAALARALGRPPMWVSDRMTGKARMNLDDIEQIARALGVNVVDLLPRAQREVTLRYPQPLTLAPFETPQRQVITGPVGSARPAVAAMLQPVPLRDGRLPRQPPNGPKRTAPTADGLSQTSRTVAGTVTVP